MSEIIATSGDALPDIPEYQNDDIYFPDQHLFNFDAEGNEGLENFFERYVSNSSVNEWLNAVRSGEIQPTANDYMYVMVYMQNQQKMAFNALLFVVIFIACFKYIKGLIRGK